VFASSIFIASRDNDGGATTKVASGGSGVGTTADGTFTSLSTIECTPLRDIGTEDNGNDGNVDGSYLVPPKGRRRRPFQPGNSTGEIGFGEISLFVVVVSAAVVLSTLVVVVRHARCMMGDWYSKSGFLRMDATMCFMAFRSSFLTAASLLAAIST